MLNGKFYTGLTENQLNRSVGPNRQKTNFFWPDDKETTARNAANNTSPRSKNNDVARKYNEDSANVRTPKELFKTQLSSKIQFHDTGDASKTPPSVRKQNQMRELNRKLYEKNTNFNVNDSAQKPKTFESKIEFYDFVETEKPREPTAKLNSTKIVQQKKKNSFDDANEWDKTKKGILKNRDVRLRVEHDIPIDISEHRTFNRNNGKKLQLSKSMDNVAKLKLSFNDDDNDRNEKVNEMTSQLNKLNINNKEKINFSRRIQPRNEVDIDYNPKEYNEHSTYNIPPARRGERHSQRNSFHGLNKDNYECIEERHSATKNFQDKGYARRHSDQYDHNERSNLRKHLLAKNNAYNDRLQANSIDETDEFHEEISKKIPESSGFRNEPRSERIVNISRSSKTYEANANDEPDPFHEETTKKTNERIVNISRSSKTNGGNAIDETDVFHDETTKTILDNSRYRNEPRNERVVNIRRSQTINGANDYPNEARRRAHAHLRSNIFF